MLQVICLFFPAFVSLVIFRKIKSSDMKSSLENTIISYGAFTFVNTAMALLIMKLLYRGVQTTVNGDLTSTFVSVSYLLVVLVVSVVTGICAKVISGYLHISLDEDEK